jgi:hypothetical protein
MGRRQNRPISVAPLTTEFWAMPLLIVAVLIAAAISDSLNDVRAWTLATIIGAAYILSRGLAKGGTDPCTFRGKRPSPDINDEGPIAGCRRDPAATPGTSSSPK